MTREIFDAKMDELFEENGVIINDDNKCEASSLQYMGLISSIEDEFEIDVPDEFLVMDSLKNVGLFKDMIYELVVEKQG